MRLSLLQDLNTALRVAVLQHPKVLVQLDRRAPMRWGMSRHALLLPLVFPSTTGFIRCRRLRSRASPCRTKEGCVGHDSS